MLQRRLCGSLVIPEPTYYNIYKGKWLNDTQPYHVVHRIASYPDAHGIFSSIMEFCFLHDTNIRIDTHRDNKIMQIGLSKNRLTNKSSDLQNSKAGASFGII